MKTNNKQHYRFWRWLILTIIRTPKLYILTWGIIILIALVCLKINMATVLTGILS